MYFSGFADEAGALLSVQIQATKELGWHTIEMRNVKVDGMEPVNDFGEGVRSAVPGGNIHDIPDAAFEQVVQLTEEAGTHVNCFGSALGNGAKTLSAPFEKEWGEAQRAAIRMQRLNTKLIRVMSYPSVQGDADQEKEGIRRLSALQKLFSDNGLQMVHENCTGFGGRSPSHTLRLLDAVPGLKLVFDTGNPTREPDHSQPVNEAGERPYQSSWEFYQQVKPFIEHIHIKDGVREPETGQHRWVMAGDGQGDVRRILADLLQSGYDGGLSIEPHLPTVCHEHPDREPHEARYRNYVAYGRRVMEIVNEVRAV